MGICQFDHLFIQESVHLRVLSIWKSVNLGNCRGRFSNLSILYVMSMIFILQVELGITRYLELIDIGMSFDKQPLRIFLFHIFSQKEKRAIINDLRLKILDRLHAQKQKLQLILVGCQTSIFRQENRYSYYRNDPVKYDLNLKLCFNKFLGFD